MRKLLCIILSLLMLSSFTLIGCEQEGDGNIGVETGDDSKLLSEAEIVGEEIQLLIDFLNGSEEAGERFAMLSRIQYLRSLLDIMLSRYEAGSEKWRAVLTDTVRYQDQLKEEYGWLLEEQSKHAYVLPTYDCFNQVNGYIYEYRPNGKCAGYYQVLNIGRNFYLDFVEEGHPVFGCIGKLSCYKNYDKKLYYLGEGKYYLCDKDGRYISLQDETTMEDYQAEDAYKETMFEKYESFFDSLVEQVELILHIKENSVNFSMDVDVNAEYVRNEIDILCSQYDIGTAEWKACWEQPLLAKIDELAKDPKYAWLKTEGSELSEFQFLYDCFRQIGGVVCEIRLDGECLGYIQLLNVGDQYFVDAVVQGEHPPFGCLNELPAGWNDFHRIYFFGGLGYYTWSYRSSLSPDTTESYGAFPSNGSGIRGDAAIRSHYYYMYKTHGVNIFVEESSNETP